MVPSQNEAAHGEDLKGSFGHEQVGKGHTVPVGRQPRDYN